MSTRTALLTGAALLLLATAGTAEERGEIRQDGDGWVETIDQVIDVGQGGTLTLYTKEGGIEVESWSKKGVRVVIEKSADVFTEEEARRVLASYRVNITRDGDNLEVRIEPSGGRQSRSLDISVKVVVPKPYSIDVETGGGGISVGDLEGNVTARTDGGGISINRVKNGSVDAHTGGGGISIEAIENGDGRADTGSGGISVGDVSGNLHVKTGGGSISTSKVGGELHMETGGGGLHVGPGSLTVTAITGSGGISIEGSEGPVTADTGGGSISVDDSGGRVVVKTGGGSISIEGAEGPVKAETGCGGISIEGAEGPVKAETGGGGISVEGSGGPVAAKTGGGSISVVGSGGPVVVETGGGGIAIEDARGYIEAKTGGGGITAELAIADPAVDTHCDLESGGGGILIRLPAELRATIDAELRLKRPKRTYTIESDFPLEIEGDPDSSDRLLARSNINGGGDVIRLRTTNGSIEIRKR